MPAMIVWPVSSSVWTWKVGSSSESESSALPSLSWSAFVLGSIATGSPARGTPCARGRSGASRSQSVSPVVVLLRPRPATMSPAYDDVDVLAWLACMRRMRPMRSLRSLRGVVDLRALLERARVDAEVRELAVGVGHDLERQRRERLVVARPCARRVSSPLMSMPSIGREVERRRQVVDDRVEQRLHALVLERRAAEHGHELDGERAGADARA